MAARAVAWYVYQPATKELVLFRDQAGALRHILGLPASGKLPTILPSAGVSIQTFDEIRRFTMPGGIVFEMDFLGVPCPGLLDVSDFHWPVDAWISVRKIGPESAPHFTYSHNSRDCAFTDAIPVGPWSEPDTLGPTVASGHPDAATGAVFQNVVNGQTLTWRLFHRTLLHESGPDYCAQVVQLLAAPDILPIVGVPELIALSYL